MEGYRINNKCGQNPQRIILLRQILHKMLSISSLHINISNNKDQEHQPSSIRLLEPSIISLNFHGNNKNQRYLSNHRMIIGVHKIKNLIPNKIIKLTIFNKKILQIIKNLIKKLKICKTIIHTETINSKTSIQLMNTTAKVFLQTEVARLLDNHRIEPSPQL